MAHFCVCAKHLIACEFFLSWYLLRSINHAELPQHRKGLLQCGVTSPQVLPARAACGHYFSVRLADNPWKQQFLSKTGEWFTSGGGSLFRFSFIGHPIYFTSCKISVGSWYEKVLGQAETLILLWQRRCYWACKEEATLVRLLVHSHLVNFPFICIKMPSTSMTFHVSFWWRCRLASDTAFLKRRHLPEQPRRPLWWNRRRQLSLPICRVLDRKSVV